MKNENTKATTPEKNRALKFAEAMWSSDHASKWFGMELVEVDEGLAVVTLTVGKKQANGLGICHGGVTFALADTAFAFACNSRNQATVAQHNSITYLAPAKIGDVLTATAKEISLNGRNGITDVCVHNQRGEAIAHFRGHSRAIKGTLFTEIDS